MLDARRVPICVPARLVSIDRCFRVLQERQRADADATKALAVAEFRRARQGS